MTAPWQLARDLVPQSPARPVRLFVLADAVLFPHTLLPLHIFEERYRELVRDAVGTATAAGDHLLVIATAERSDADTQGLVARDGTRFARIAGLGQIVLHQGLPDGRSNIALLGVGRVRLERLVPVTTLYDQATATLLPAREHARLATPAARRLARELVACARLVPAIGALPGTEQIHEEGVPLDVVLDTIGGLPMVPVRERLALLALDDPVARIERTIAALAALRIAARHTEDDSPL